MPDLSTKPARNRWTLREKFLGGITALAICAWVVAYLNNFSNQTPNSPPGTNGFLDPGHMASLLESVGEPVGITVGAREASANPSLAQAFEQFYLETENRDEVYALLARFHEALLADLERRSYKITFQGTGGHYLGNPMSTLGYSHRDIEGGVVVNTFVKDGGVVLVYYAYEHPR